MKKYILQGNQYRLILISFPFKSQVLVPCFWLWTSSAKRECYDKNVFHKPYLQHYKIYLSFSIKLQEINLNVCKELKNEREARRLNRVPYVGSNLQAKRAEFFTLSSWMRRYWFYVKNDFRNFHQIFTFWDPLSQKKWFLRKCLSVCL